MKPFSPKTPSAEELFGFNFILQLPAGVTIASAQWIVTVLKGVDANPSAMLSGNPIINGTKVSQKIIGGLDGVQYCLTCIATTSDGEKIPLFASLWVRASCAQL